MGPQWYQTQGRPSGLPVYGLTWSGRVVTLLELSPRDWERLALKEVTGLIPEGWKTWYPVEPQDQERVLAERQRRIDERKRPGSESQWRPPRRVRRIRN
jgi:hypothetical protein